LNITALDEQSETKNAILIFFNTTSTQPYKIIFAKNVHKFRRLRRIFTQLVNIYLQC